MNSANFLKAPFYRPPPATASKRMSSKKRINPNQDGRRRGVVGGGEGQRVEVSPPIFLTFNLNPFATLV